MQRGRNEIDKLKAEPEFAEKVMERFFEAPPYLTKQMYQLEALDLKSVRKKGNKQSAADNFRRLNVKNKIKKEVFGYKDKTLTISDYENKRLKKFAAMTRRLGITAGGLYPTESMWMRRFIDMFLIEDVFGIWAAVERQYKDSKAVGANDSGTELFITRKEQEKEFEESENHLPANEWWDDVGRELYDSIPEERQGKFKGTRDLIEKAWSKKKEDYITKEEDE